MARARVTPGVTTTWHRVRETWERYLILSGTGVVEVGDLSPTPVAPGDVVLIPPGVRQRIGQIVQVPGTLALSIQQGCEVAVQHPLQVALGSSAWIGGKARLS